MAELSLADLFADDSETAAQMRSQFANVQDVADGVPTLLGAVETWPPSLKSVFGILLHSGCPMFLVWDHTLGTGTASERVLFYNEAYRSLFNGTQHLPGQRNDRWTADGGTIQADVEQVLSTGQALERQQNLIPTDPNHKSNELLYTWSYNPVWDETGQIRGVFATGYRVSKLETDDLSSLHNLDEGLFSPLRDRSDRQTIAQFRERFLRVGSDLLVITGVNGYFQWVSPTFERTLGWTVAEMTARPWTDFVHPDDISTSILETDHLFAGNESIGFENRYRHKDGSYRWFLWRAQPYPAEQVIYGAAVDITERKQAEATLQAKSAELQHVTEMVGVGLTRCSRDLRYLSVNPAYAELAGIGVEEIVGRPIADVMGQAALERIRPYFERVLCGERVEYEAEVPFATGGVRYLHVVYTPDKDGEGNIIGWIASVMDITDRKQAEAERERLLSALATERTRFAAVLHQMPEGVIIADAASGELILANERTNQILRYAFELNLALEAYDQKVPFHAYHPNGNIYAPEDYPLARSLRSGEVVTHEMMEIRYVDGSQIVIAASSAPILDDQGQITAAIVVMQDITDRKGAEDDLRQSEERLRIAQQAANAGVWDWDITTNQVTWSDAYYRLYGLDPTTPASYENWLRSIMEPDRDRTDQATREALKQQIDLNVEFRVLHPTLGERWLTAIGQTFFDDSGQPIRMTGIALDITHRKQAEKALEHYQLLSEYSRDIVLYFRSTGQILEANQAAVQAYGYDRAELLTLTISDLRMPDTLAVMPEQFEQAAQQGILFETMHRRNDGSAFPVEVSAQSAVIGGEPVVLSIIRDITERRQAEMEREQLLIQEQATRAVAEAAEQRAEFLAAASETLASSLDYEYTLKSVAQAVVPSLADWCAVDILKDDGTLERLATAHVDPAKVQWGLELHRRYPPDLNAPHGIAQVLRTGQSEYYPTISDDQIVAAARDDEHLRILREIGFSSVMLIPLNARGRTLGTLCFVAAESGRMYSPADFSLAEELARRSAIALDNARLYQEAHQARQAAERAADRTSRLQTVTAALSESLTPTQVAAVIVEQSMATLAATAALVVLVSHDQTELEIVKAVGYQADLVESWRRFSINTDVPLATAIRTGEPIWVETLLDRIARYPHLAEIYNRYEFNGWIALPLVVEGKSIGGMLLSFTEFRLLNQEERDFILALTQQCAQAIVRAQLYEAERQARAAAEQANRIKDEFLAVLSHELRSPLNPILGWSKLLQSGKLDAAKTQQALKTIERNAQLQAELIEDLLDVSRILQGKLNLSVNSINLVSIIRAAMETVRLAAEAKSIQVEVSLEPDVGLVSGDATRLQQVVWNLVSNAVKFTPTGGHVSIQLERLDSDAQITVSDTGQGIAPDFLPHVFDYFRQADGTTTRQFGGLGLGLAIVRHLVELHGGTVRAASPGIGMGATFTVRLPLMPPVAIAQQTAQSSVRPSDLRGMQVLAVDDEPDSREFVAFVLEQAGATVLTAATAAEALTLLLQAKPDVLLSDIGMPMMDGYTLMQQVRGLPTEQGGQIPAIALTAYAGEMNQQQALAAGFQRHLAKPVQPEALVQAIISVVRQA